MKKAVIIPDSFKGTLTSQEAANIMGAEVEKAFPGVQIVRVPVADGGEGTVAAFLTAAGGKRVEITVQGPFFMPTPSFYGRLPDGTAVIEMAAAAGLLLAGERREVEKATTFGVGELMHHALEGGAKRIVLGLGGSATNDGGCGAAAALGAIFTDNEGRSFVPTGATLKNIAHIDVGELRQRLEGVDVTVMCDIDNPLCGKYGAAAVFGPQKGADARMVRYLDEGLSHLAMCMRRDLGVAVTDLPGAGAAGGMGAGAAAFFDGRLTRGIDAVLDTTCFEEQVKEADVIFTGEGRFDAQSLMGKVVGGVARRVKPLRLPVVVIAGGLCDDVDSEMAAAAGISAVFSITPEPLPFAAIAPYSRENLRRTMENLLRFWKVARQA